MAAATYATTEKKREKWEFDNFPEGEKREMVEIYMQRGMKEEDATIIIETMSKYEDIFVDVMMVEELGLMPPEEESSFMNGLVTFVAFSLFGFVVARAFSFLSCVCFSVAHDPPPTNSMHFVYQTDRPTS